MFFAFLSEGVLNLGAVRFWGLTMGVVVLRQTVSYLVSWARCWLVLNVKIAQQQG